MHAAICEILVGIPSSVSEICIIGSFRWLFQNISRYKDVFTVVITTDVLLDIRILSHKQQLKFCDYTFKDNRNIGGKRF